MAAALLLIFAHFSQTNGFCQRVLVPAPAADIARFEIGDETIS
jgi:hypothetical protein